MKSYSLILLLLFFSLIAQAQQSNFYVSGSFGNFRNSFGSKFASELNAEVKNKNMAYWILFAENASRAKNIPDNYKSGISLMGDDSPVVTFATFGFTIGKYYTVSSKSGIRLVVKMGVVGNIMESPEKYTPVPCSGWFCGLGGNYTIDYVKTFHPGLMLMPRLEIPIYRKIGGLIGASANINTKHSAIYGHGGLIFGFEGSPRRF